MRSDELRDTGRVAGETLHQVTVTARDTHRAVAGRLFGLANRFTGQAGRPAQLLHDGISTVVYACTDAGVRALPVAAGWIGAAMADPAAVSAHDVPRGRFNLGALSGVIGDQVASDAEALAPQTRLRLHGGPLRHLAGNLVADAAQTVGAGTVGAGTVGAAGTAHPVTGRLVVFAHGLCETDLCWSYAAEQRWGDRTVTYGSKLRDDDGWTPLYLNYNSGLHISVNGRELADQLEAVVRDWPVPVTEIALVGHSMGGLVARSAANQAHEAGMAWPQALRHVVGLGTPHLGAPLERFANWGTHQLARLPETRAFANLLNRRSVGIKDLRYGALLEADWLDADPDELLRDRVTPAVLVPGVVYSMASATLSHRPEGPFAFDLLVQHASAHGIGKVRSMGFDPSRTHHIGGKHHFDLLADATVYDALRGWLAGADGAAPPEQEPVNEPVAG